MSRIGVVTVTHNSSEVLPEFLESVWKQTHADFLLIVVDSGSTDGTLELLGQVQDHRLRIINPNINVGFSAGSNLGMRLALKEQCDALMLLNNDTVFGPEMFARLLAGLKDHACDITTPKMLYHEALNRIWAAGGRLNRWIGYRNRPYGKDRPDDGTFDHPKRITYVPFCCVLMRGEVFQQLGPLDETYFVYVEDVDYCYRALKSRISMWYIPQSRLYHKVSSLTGGIQSNFSIAWGTKSRTYYMLKNLPLPFALIWTLIYAGSQFMRYLTGRDSREVWDLRWASIREGIQLSGHRLSQSPGCNESTQ